MTDDLSALARDAKRAAELHERANKDEGLLPFNADMERRRASTLMHGIASQIGAMFDDLDLGHHLADAMVRYYLYRTK